MILVTTPNGKVGSAVVKQLVAQGAPLRVGAHTVAKAQAAFPGVDVARFDFADEDSVQAALAGVDTLYLASPGDMLAEPIKRVVDLARSHGVERIVRLSALGVEQGESPLREVERHIEGSGLVWTLLRPNFFMQNYSTINAASIRDEGAIYEPAEDAKTSFVDARDIAAVAVKALTEDGHAGKAYAITGGRVYDRQEVAAAISEVIGKEVRYVPTTDEQLRAAMVGAAPHFIDLMSTLYQGVRAGWTATVTDTVERVTGRAPYTIEQFARDYSAVWLGATNT